jgi:4-hydroxy-tetrahydrodipicolinate reductase
MGAAVCRAVDADAELELVAAVGRRAGPAPVEAVDIGTDIGAFAAAGCDVVVDFTTAAAARENVAELLRQGIHAVVGTSGFDSDDLDGFAAAAAAGGSNVIVAANFAVSAVLMSRLCELAAPFFDTVEIVELHHDRKIDAPSGTAIATAERIAAASSDWAADPTRSETLAGARGARGPGGIRIHSVRMRGLIAHQEVIFGALGQSLTVRQDSYDVSGFMPGVMLACKRIGELPGLTVGLDALLDV